MKYKEQSINSINTIEKFKIRGKKTVSMETQSGQVKTLLVFKIVFDVKNCN